MNRYWPKEWKKMLPNFLGEDFFSTFEDLENMDMDAEQENQNTNMNVKRQVNSSSIKVDIYQSGHELLCVFRLPGLKLNDVKIDVYEATLEIIGTVFMDHKEFTPIYQEIYQGPVRRKVKLPFPVRHDKIDASYHHGYLFIHLHQLIRSREVRPKVTIEDLDKDTF